MALTRRALLGALAAAAASAACAPARHVASRPGRSAGSPNPASGAPSNPPARRPQTGPAREIDAGNRAGSLVALTFHGQGDPALTTALLDEAERAGAHLTIFAIGSWLAANPSLAHRIAAGRHELANHTQHHLPMAQMGEATAYAEFAGCAEVLRKLTGTPGRWVRPSGTPHSTPALRAAAGRAGYRVCVGYDVDSLDYTDPGADVVRRRCATAMAGSIVSLHLGHPGTITALPGVLADLHTKALRPVTLTALLGAP